MSNRITEFLSSQVNLPDAEEVRNRKDLWIASLRQLYAQIDGWLKEARGEGLIENFYTGEMQITEARLGSYLVPEISFTTGTTSIRFVPRGTYVVAADGRVDVHATSGRGVTLIVKDGGWFLLDPDTRMLSELGEATFLELLKFLIKG